MSFPKHKPSAAFPLFQCKQSVHFGLSACANVDIQAVNPVPDSGSASHACYSVSVQDHPHDLTHWQPVPFPPRTPLAGRAVALEPLDATRHTAALFAAACGHDDLWTWLGDGPFSTEDALGQALQRKQHATDAVFYALIPESSGRCAGYASYMRIDAANGVLEVGNILLTPALQRTTAATEAMYLMARHVFEDLGYRRYEWKCNALNAPSRRAALRYGFTFEGIFRQHMIVKGQSRDTAWFAMLDHEWPARKRVFEAWLSPANFDAEGRQRQSLSDLAASLGLT